MNEQEKLKHLKQEYKNIEIPLKLDTMIEEVFMKQTSKYNKNKSIKTWQKVCIAASIVFVTFVGSINLSPTFANTLENIPFIGTIVKVFTFTNYVVNENGFEANIEVPNIEGLENKDLESELNNKFISDGQELYKEFIIQMEQIKNQGQGHMALESNYETKTDNDTILSIVLTQFTAMGSSDAKFKTYNIDKINNSVITLPSLFKNDTYVDIISEDIIHQIKDIMATDENKIYFIDDTEMIENNFTKINPNQNFYINNDGKLVILFDKYEIAPGYMGVQEFLISTDKINNLLLDRNLIK